MTALSHLHHPSPHPLITWTQNTAIFAVCVNLFSTALANLGFALFLLLFLAVCLSGQRRHLDVQNFPAGFAVALAVYFGWQVIGLSYTAAPLSYGMETIYSDRKILYILPLVLLFSGAEPKRRFLVAFFGLAAVGMLLSFALAAPFVQQLMTHSPLKFTRSSMPLGPENLFRSYATQSMVFALCAFLSQWFASQQKKPARKWLFHALSLGFLVNIATVTDGRSGYVVFLVLVVWCFVLWRGLKGVVLGTFAALLVGAVAFTFSSSVHDRIMKGVTEIQGFTTTPTETSLGRRMVMYQTTLGIIRDNPLFGLGTGGFKQEFSAIAAEKYSGWRANPAGDPHNQYLFILAENGLVGLAAFLSVLAMILKYALKSGTIYGKMAAGCLLAWGATSLFSGHFRTFPEGHLIAFIVGILMISRAPDGRQTNGAA
ncbi:MAG: O-antigen ligase family protein [Polaromonas sp.]|uniref:O-antigen ligase family protein n=1 Tax=Polaromonas sp. TaxID=1869339 RepID=UPI0027342984|nr:O-antigen ligase family protein [Polaromonas sp.]MDP2817468.1 O-antigen ligase family protein [Polaromonas sp.]